jgi:gliding motility-associated-like protein
MLRNVNVMRTAGLFLLLLTGLGRTVSAQAPVAGIDANDTIVCVGNSISFTDISVPGGAAITGWNWTFGDGGSSVAQNPSYAYTVGGNYTVQLIVTDALGNKDTATQAIFVLLAQAVNNTIRICSPQTTTTIIAVDPNISGVSGTWFSASSAVIASPANDTTLVSNLVSGTYLFFWVVSDGTCSDADQVTVIVDQPVTVNAGPDQQICTTPGTATMAASNPAPGTGVWSTTSTATIANPANRNTTISNLNAAGTYVFVWTVTNGACVTRDTMNIVVTSPVVPNPGPDQSVCSNPGTATLAATAPAQGTGAWSTSSSAVIASPSSNTSAVSGLTTAGTYTFVWTITNGACVTRDSMDIVVTTPVAANAGADIQICTSTAQGTLTATNPAPGSGTWSAVSSGTIVSPNNPTTLVTGLNTAGTYNFVWTVTNGPCVTRDTVSIVVSAQVVAAAGADQRFCTTSTATVTGNNPSPGTGAWTTTGSATIATPNASTSAISNLAYGQNTFVYTITVGACVSRDTIVIIRDSLVTANAGPDQNICESQTSITMAGNNPAPGTGLWTKLNGGTITTPSSPTTTITALTPGTHVFVWTVTNGTCVSRDTMSVVVSIQIPSNAGLDQQICQGGTAVLSGNNPTPASGLWTTTSSAVIASPSSPSTNVSGFTNAGTYIFVWTVTNGACVLRDTARVTVDSLIAANAGPDQNLCNVSVATMAANTPASGSGLWTSLGTAVVTTPASAVSGITALAYGNNTFVWTITNGSCTSRDTVVIRRDSSVTANAGPDQAICSSPGTAVMAANTPSSGTGVWTTTSSAVIANTSSPTTAVSGMSTAGTYTFVWTITNGACVTRDTIRIVVSQAVTANAGPDQILCNVTSATLAGNNAAPGTGTWTTTSSAVIVAANNPNSAVNNLVAGTYTFVWTIVNGSCTSRDTVSIRVDSLVTANAGPDQGVCAGTTVTMSANAPGLGSGIWTALNGGTITNSSSPSTTITGLSIAGTYSFVWTITNSSCISRDTVTITVDAVVVANAGSDQQLCDVTSTSLSGNNAAPGTGLWSTTSSAVIAVPSSPTSAISGLIAGSYSFVWTITNGACQTTDTVEVTVDSLEAAAAGPDQQVCQGSTVTMAANASTLGVGLWTDLNGGVIANPNSETTTITGLNNAGTYSFVWTIVNGVCISTDTITITVDSLPVANAGTDQQLCNDATATLAANAPSPGSGLWSTTSSAVITTPTDENSGVTGLVTGTYQFVWTITNGTCTSSDTVEIFIDSLEVAAAGPDQQVCQGSTVTMAANATTLGVGLWTDLNGGVIANPNSETTTITGLNNAGTYSFVWTIVNGVCISTDTITITVDSLPVANAGADQQLCNDATATLAANAPSPGSGLWSTISSAVITTPTDENSGVTGLVTGTYQFVWTITNGTCTSSDTVEIFIDSLEVAAAGPDQQVCQGSTVTMAANATTLGVGLWTDLNGGVIANPNSETTTITGLNNAGSYSFVWTIVNGVCISTDTITITVDSLEVALAGTDLAMCDTFDTALSANTPSIGAGQWTTSGTATFALNTDPNTIVSNLSYGDNELIWTITNGSCQSSDTLHIVVDSLIQANAGFDQLVCQGDVVNLTANAPASGSGLWTALDGAIVATPNSAATTASGLLNAGLYSFAWTITNGACSSSDTLVIVTDSLEAALAGPDQALCETQTTTNLAANTPNLGFGTWSTTSSAVIDNVNDPNTLISGLAIGTYDFIWTIVNSTCTSTDTVTITVSALSTPSNAGADQQGCADLTFALNGNVPLVGTGAWSSLGTATVDNPASETSTVSNLVTGINEFVWTITNGACSSSDTVVILVYPLPLADAGADQFVTSGTLVTLGGSPAASGGTGSYSYQWTPGGALNDSAIANPDVTINATSTFILTVTDSLGCSASDTITIWVNNPPDAQNDTTTTPEDTAVTVDILLNDSDPDTNLDTLSVAVLQGPFNGTVLIGAGGVLTYTPNPNYYGPDSLYYTVCDSGIPVYCDSAWVFFNITPVNDAPIALDDTASTPEDSCVQIAILANDSDIENMLVNGSLVILTGPSNGTVSIDTLNGILTYCPDSNFVGADTLVYMICDSGFPLPGLCDTALVVINVLSENDPPIAVSDTAYLCSGDAAFVPVLTNDYDPEGDTLTLSVLIPPVNGNAVITPTQEIIYSSNPGTTGWDSLQYVVCDQQTPAGCDTAWLFVYVHPTPQISAVVTDVLCAGDSTGAIDVTMNPTGTYTFNWSNGSVDEDIDSLTAGEYILTVIDSNGCIVVLTDTVFGPANPLTVFAVPTDVLCYGDSTGSIDIQVIGGTTPYAYSWDNGSTDEDIDSLFAGTYNVLITDSNGCTLSSPATVNGPVTPLSVTLTSSDVFCGGDSTGAISTSVTGGTPGYVLSWSNGVTDSLNTLLPAGTYTLTVTDTNGCTLSLTDTIFDTNPAITLSATVVEPHCLSGVTGSIAVAGGGGLAPLTYLWSNGDTLTTIDTLAAGGYQLTITDANGCTLDSLFDLKDTSAIVIAVNGSDTFCQGDTTILSVDYYAGVSYQWLYNGNPLANDTTNQLVVTTGGDYEILATSGCGPFNDGPVTITVNTLPVVDGGSDATITCDSVLTLSATGALNYSWTPSALCTTPDQATTDISADVTTTFIVVGTDGNGCSSLDTVIVTVTCDTLFVPSGFSPNGDNVNDFFVINQIDKYPNANLKIFNRWGSLVFEMDKYDNTWNGFSNSDLVRVGEELPNGTYYYVLDLKDGSTPLNGFVILRR